MWPPMRNDRSFISPTVLNRIVKHSANNLPNEVGGFLIGNPLNPHTVLDVITTNSVGTPTSWQFTEKEYKSAVRRAAKKGLSVVGMFHTHPSEDHIHHGNVVQSQTDSKTQSEMNFALSLIVAIGADSVYLTMWKSGLNAPLPIFTTPTSTRKSISWDKYLSRNMKFSWWRKPFPA